MTILYTLEKMRTPFFHDLFLGISYLGAEVVSVIVMFAFYWCVSKKKGFFLVANILFGMSLNNTIKLIAHVPRPFVTHPDFSIEESARATASGYSFPSGHSQNSTSLYGSVAVVVKNRWIRILCIVMIALVVFSRLYLGAHYPADVLGGVACGLAVLIFLGILFRKYGEHPSFIPVLFGIAGIVLIAAGLMFEFGPWSGIADPEKMPEMMKVISLSAGCALGVAAGEPIERKYVRFETRAVWWAQILKTAAGLAIFAALILVMKIPADAIFKGRSIGYALRFFVPAVFVVCVWPMSFRWFSRLGSHTGQNGD